MLTLEGWEQVGAGGEVWNLVSLEEQQQEGAPHVSGHPKAGLPFPHQDQGEHKKQETQDNESHSIAGDEGVSLT